MEERNLDLQIPVSREQWDQLGRTAQAIRASGYDWRGDDPERIRILLKDEEARGAWTRLVSDESEYGESELEVAQVVFNGGRPYAHLEAHPAVEPPAVRPEVEDAVEQGQAHFVRDRWQHLLRESGLHFDAGSIPTDIE